jgi:hypothetical protein
MRKRHPKGALDHAALARSTAAKIQKSFGAHMQGAQMPQPPSPPPDRSEAPIIPQGGDEADSGGF